MEILVLTISDRASKGIYEDLSGPAIERIVNQRYPDAVVTRLIVADEPAQITAAFAAHPHCDWIITTGGTGLSPRDITPETTTRFCDRLVPGIAEVLRGESLKETPNAMLSRGVAGQKGKTIIVNVPGSVRGAQFCTGLLLPVLDHAPKMIRGSGH